MIVYLDQGNTRAKWCIESNSEVVGVGIDDVPSLPNLSRCLAEQQHVSVVDVWVSNVAGSEYAELLSQSIVALTGVAPKYISVQAELCGVRAAYADISTLGVDRWLGIIAAYHQTGAACLVISAGTALVLDKVDGGGCHLGGLIAPGWSLLRSGLESKTANIATPEFGVGGGDALGDSTLACLQGGASLMLLSFVEMAVSQFGGAGIEVILCGGDAAVIAERVNIKCSVETSLVLDGMRLVAAELQRQQ